MIKMKNWYTLIAGIVLVSAALIAPCSADELSQAGKQIVTKWQDSVITLQLVVKTTMTTTGEEPYKKEDKLETTGTIIDPTGLTVVALSAISPSEAYGRMMATEMPDMKITSDVTDLKMILPGGQSIPGSVVLRDKDLDMAFIRPKQKLATPAAALDIAKASPLAMLDNAIILYRMGTIGGRAIASCTDRVQAVIEKPRTFYALGLPAMNAPLGAPVFAVDGNPVGILVLRVSPGGLSGSSGGMSGSGVMYVVLPCTDIAEAAKQAPMSAPAAPVATEPAKPAAPANPTVKPAN